MATYEISLDGGKTTYAIDGVESQQQAYEMLQQQQAAAGPAPAPAPAAPGAPSGTFSVGKLLNDIPRQLGLTARYAMTGPAEAAQMFTEPLRQIVTDPARRLLGDSSPSEPLGSLADRLADKIGLPKPQNALERTIGTATKLGFGTGALSRTAQAGADLMAGPTRAAIAEVAPSTATAGESTLRALAANPGQQIASGAGAGGAGQASREAGGTPFEQTVAAVLGGLTGGAAAGGMGTRELLDAGMRRFSRPTLTPQDLDVRISAMLQPQQIDYAALPAAAKAALRQEVQQAMNTGGTLDPQRLARLADFRAVGATPMRSHLSQLPADVTQDQNLVKLVANTGAGAAEDSLPNLVHRNNAALIGRLDDLGANRNVQPVDAGRAIVGSVTGRRDALRAAEKEAWNAARNSPGYKQPISADPLNAIVKNLGQEGENVLGFLPQQITDYMAAFQKGRPFTPSDYRNLQSMLAKAANSQDGNQAYAAGTASRMLRDAELTPLKQGAHIDSGGLPINSATAASMRRADTQASDSLRAVNEARGATRRAYEYEDSNPLVRSVLSEGRSADPTRIAQSWVIGGTPDEARTLARELGPGGAGQVRDSLIAWIKQKAMGAGDAKREVGQLNSQGLNAALERIGDEKLRVFFTADELEMLKRVGRVATYTQNQPAGSAVNNSNTAAMQIGRALDSLGRMFDRVPVGGPFLTMGVTQPAQRLTATIAARGATNAPKALIAPPQMPPAARPLPLLLPGIAAGGSLLAPTGQ